MSREVVLPERPLCDLCATVGKRVPAAIDGRLPQGPWAYVCELHAELNGVTLGLGHGQRLIVEPQKEEA
jgi:hypothetical protein